MCPDLHVLTVPLLALAGVIGFIIGAAVVKWVSNYNTEDNYDSGYSDGWEDINRLHDTINNRDKEV